MIKIRNLLVSISLILFVTSCGFKVVNKSDQANFNIVNISSTGEKRINYKIKNELLFYSNADQINSINLELETTKNKIIKEKNINNKITKYEVVINVSVTIIETSSLNINKFKVSKSGDYSVATQHSQTLNNEKKLLDLLIDEISNDIFDKISAKFNAI